jgi:hypothetical protein
MGFAVVHRGECRLCRATVVPMAMWHCVYGVGGGRWCNDCSVESSIVLTVGHRDGMWCGVWCCGLL